MTIEKDSAPPIPNWLLENRAITQNDRERVRLAGLVCSKFEGVAPGHLVVPGKNPQAQRARAVAMHLFVSLGLATQDDLMELFGCMRSEIKKADEDAMMEPLGGVVGEIREEWGKPSENKDRAGETIPAQEVADAVRETTALLLKDMEQAGLTADSRRGEQIGRQTLMYLLQKLSGMTAGKVADFMQLKGATGGITSTYNATEDLMSLKIGLRPERKRLRDNILNVCKHFGITEAELRKQKKEEPRFSKAGNILEKQ